MTERTYCKFCGGSKPIGCKWCRPSDPASPAESLPVVGFADTKALAANVADGYPYEYLTKDATNKRTEPLVRLSDAEFQLSALREQVARLERERDEALASRDTAIEHSNFRLSMTREAQDLALRANDQWASAQVELAALKASKAAPLDVERVMALASQFATAYGRLHFARQCGGPYAKIGEETEAAREALRAALAAPMEDE